MTVNPAAVTGGAASTGTVTLGTAAPAGGAVVTLASNNINAATVPASVTVAANATTATFAITTKAVTAVTAVTITATYSGVAKTATLTVNPPAALAGVTVNPAAVTGGVGQHGHGDARHSRAGGRRGGDAGEQQHQCGHGAGLGDGGGQCHHGHLRDHDQGGDRGDGCDDHGHLQRRGQDGDADSEPAGSTGLAGVTMNPATMIFGSSSTGTVTLTSAAPAGGAVVALSSSEWVSFVLPASVTVPAGATSAQFPVTTAIGKATTIITASYNGVNKTATLTSVYPTVAALTCTPNPVIAGNTTVCTVTLNGIMPAATHRLDSVGPAVLRARFGYRDGAGWCGQYRFFHHDDPCPRSDRCAHLGQRPGDRHGDSAADDQPDEPRQEVGPEQRRLQGRQHGERLFHL